MTELTPSPPLSNLSLWLAQGVALVEPEGDFFSNLANLSAFVSQSFEALNWVGFYVARPSLSALILGPFQGKIACSVIPFEKGVCGRAFSLLKPLYVPDVHAFEGHIACDSASESELVIPLVDARGRGFAVLDIDSPQPQRFNPQECSALEQLAAGVSPLLAPQYQAYYNEPG